MGSFFSRRTHSARVTARASRGFTLIELLVVAAIIVVITAVVVTSQGSFNRTLILANTAYDIALSFRSAETYGLGGREVSTHPTGYGIHLDKAAPKNFIFFADSYPTPSTSSVCHPTADIAALDAQPGNCAYDPGQDVTVSTYTIGNGISIGDFCAFSSGSWSCANSNGGSISTLDVVFSRPNPTPFVSVNGAYPIFPVTNVCLLVQTSEGASRSVAITSSGEITASATPCP